MGGGQPGSDRMLIRSRGELAGIGPHPAVIAVVAMRHGRIRERYHGHRATQEILLASAAVPGGRSQCRDRVRRRQTEPTSSPSMRKVAEKQNGRAPMSGMRVVRPARTLGGASDRDGREVHDRWGQRRLGGAMSLTCWRSSRRSSCGSAAPRRSAITSETPAPTGHALREADRRTASASPRVRLDVGLAHHVEVVVER